MAATGLGRRGRAHFTRDLVRSISQVRTRYAKLPGLHMLLARDHGACIYYPWNYKEYIRLVPRHDRASASFSHESSIIITSPPVNPYLPPNNTSWTKSTKYDNLMPGQRARYPN
ncbi:hypothetical protein VTJ04DRAFT_1735 [Mycothermus thermophilus]|uniref:uncharacterized protein n=1 Tax=Humicola insolens TaxID=85995 RepID=UPI003743FA38